jgi:hypothetical protein
MNIRTAILSLAVIATSVPLFAQAAPCQDTFHNGACIYGEPSASTSERTIDLSAKQRIDVAYGETVKFVDQGRSFAWTFDGLGERAVDLSKILPAGIDTRSATVYVAASGEPQE